MQNSAQMNVAIAQIAPVWLDKQKTIEKIIAAIEEAAWQQATLVCFGETLLPGYPFWLSMTGGSRFNDRIQKEIFAHYLQEAVNITSGDLDSICLVAAQHSIAVYLGCAEVADDRAGHSIYCSLIYIDHTGMLQSVHRKLMPTYEERLVWGIGDGHGLRVHSLGDFMVGGLNCWENWMPLARTALYAQGENLHVAVWPGGLHNTEYLTRHIAQENRMYVISVSGLMRKSDILDLIPHHELIKEHAQEVISNGGSCIAAPDGTWLVEPIVNKEAIVTVNIDMHEVRKERQNFDPSGHYSRPDVFSVQVDRTRQKIVSFKDEYSGD